MVDINGLKCYIHTEMDCYGTGENPNLKVLMKIQNFTGNSLCVGV